MLEDTKVQRAIDNKLFKLCPVCKCRTMCGICRCTKSKHKD